MNCKNCKAHPCSLAGKNHEMSFECKRFTAKTNADRIRAMSDEELAEWIAEYTDCLCKIHKDGCSKTKNTCVATWLDWLKQEASE